MNKPKIPAWAIVIASRGLADGCIKAGTDLALVALDIAEQEPSGIFKKMIRDGIRECTDMKAVPPRVWHERFSISSWAPV